MHTWTLLLTYCTFDHYRTRYVSLFISKVIRWKTHATPWQRQLAVVASATGGGLRKACTTTHNTTQILHDDDGTRLIFIWISVPQHNILSVCKNQWECNKPSPHASRSTWLIPSWILATDTHFQFARFIRLGLRTWLTHDLTWGLYRSETLRPTHIFSLRDLFG